MPAIGEKRSVGSDTRVWNGAGWERIASEAPAAAAPAEEGAGSRFFNSLLGTSPLNPMNLVRALAHPVDTVGHMISDPLEELFKSGQSAYNAVANPTNEGAMGRITNAVDAVKHLGGAVPFIGKAGGHAGNEIGEGNIAGGLGEVAGLASAALMPEAASRVKSGMQTAGRVAREVAPVSGSAALSVAEKLPWIGDTIKATRGEIPKIVDAARRGIEGPTAARSQAAFNELPLSEQMNSLPTRGRAPVPETGRAGMPMRGEVPESAVPEAPFHELPLWQQMESAGPEFQTSLEAGNPRGGVPRRGEAPEIPGATPQTSVGYPRLAGKAPVLNDTLNSVLESLRGGAEEARPSVGGSPTPRYTEPRAGGYDVPAEPSAPPAGSLRPGGDMPEMPNESYNRLRNAPYGEGQVISSSVTPTEMLDSSLEGLDAQPRRGSYDVEYNTFVPEFSFEGEAFNPGEAPAVGGAPGGFELTKNRLPDRAAAPEAAPAKSGISTDRLHRILKTFTDPATETPFDVELLNQILADPEGLETFSKPYGASGSR